MWRVTKASVHDGVKRVSLLQVVGVPGVTLRQVSTSPAGVVHSVAGRHATSRESWSPLSPASSLSHASVSHSPYIPLRLVAGSLQTHCCWKRVGFGPYYWRVCCQNLLSPYYVELLVTNGKQRLKGTVICDKVAHLKQQNFDLSIDFHALFDGSPLRRSRILVIYDCATVISG